MRRIHLLLTATATVAVIGAAALAQTARDPQTSPGDRIGRAFLFEQMDADKDGKISKAEFEAFRNGQFKAADKNGDGVIGKDEFAAHAETLRAEAIDRLFARYDRNNDGKITADELPLRRGARDGAMRFESIEGSRKGHVTLEEYAKAAAARLEARAKQRFERLDANKDGKLMADEIAGRDSLLRSDANNDGAVTLEEFLAPARAQFARAIEIEFKALDVSGDGKLTAAEYRSGAAKPRFLLLADANRDGVLTKDEVAKNFAERGGAFRDRLFERIDADKDGKITAAEWKAAGDRLFGRLDRNNDGLVELGESRRDRRR